MPQQGWTRRQVLGAGGSLAAGIVGLSMAGCSAEAASKTRPAVAPKVQRFISRPDLTPPVVTVHTNKIPDDPRCIFLNAPWTGAGHGGTMILDHRGDLVWFGSNSAAEHRMDFDAQTYQGKQVLTWYQGQVLGVGYGNGEAVVADSSYRTTHVIRAARGEHVDLHEFTITPQGTALVTAFQKMPADLRPVGGPASGQMLTGIAQEIDIATGKLLFEWNSWDHIGLTETYQKRSDQKAGTPFDYFHINSISLAPDGNLLIGARNTWAVYKVNRRTGEVIWRLGGKKSDFEMGPGTQFYWQHHSRLHGPDVMTIYDDGANPPEEKSSRALILAVDEKGMKVTLRRQFIHPHKNVLAMAMGSAQLLPGGGMFVGWGTSPYFSQFGPDGALLFDASVDKNAPSYRAFTHEWHGHPTAPPALAVRHRPGGATVYASWNGATEVASWKVLAGASDSALTLAGSARRNGFETAIRVPQKGPYFAVRAYSADGKPLGRSPVVKIA